MEIKYDDLDLLELFYSDAESLTGNIEDGELLYKKINGDFKVTLFLYIYEQKINIFLQYKEKDITSIELENISNLKKVDNYLKIYENENEKANIHFGEIFTIRVEN